MTNRPRLLVHGIIALLSVGSAFWVWARSGRKTGLLSTIIFDIRREEIRSLRFVSGGYTLTLQPKKATDQEDAHIWVTLEDKGTVIRFRGDSFAEHVVDGFVPLKARRELGNLTEEQRREGGLADPNEMIEVDLADAQHRLFLGSVVVSGEGRRVLAPAIGEAYLVAPDIIPTPADAMREMFESSLHGYKSKEVKGATIRVGDRSVMAERADVKWLWREARNSTAPELSSFMQSTLEIMAVSPWEGVLADEPAFSLIYEGRKNKLGFLKMWEAMDKSGMPVPVAMTEYTIVPVQVSAEGLQLIHDSKGILKGVPVNTP